jgi:hypothetical protein
VHGIDSVENAPTARNDRTPSVIKGKQLYSLLLQRENLNNYLHAIATETESLSDESELEMAFSSPLCKDGKRGHQIEKEDCAKRRKVDLQPSEKRGQQKGIAFNKESNNHSDSFLGLLKLRDKAESKVEEIFVPNVGIFDFITLSKHEGLSKNSSSLLHPHFRHFSSHKHSYSRN